MILDVIAVFWLIFGLFFFAVGTLGVVRLPDAYSRLHASSKVATLGLLGILFGVGFINPGSFLKLIVVGLFVTLTAPVASHAIAKADKTYSQRQRIARDSSISAAGEQTDIRSTQEIELAEQDATLAEQEG